MRGEILFLSLDCLHPYVSSGALCSAGPSMPKPVSSAAMTLNNLLYAIRMQGDAMRTVFYWTGCYPLCLLVGEEKASGIASPTVPRH